MLGNHLQIYNGSEPIPSQLPDNKIDLTAFNMNVYDLFLLDTKVHIHGNIWLTRHESSLTLPLELALQKPFQNSSVIFTYLMEPQIELNCRFE